MEFFCRIMKFTVEINIIYRVIFIGELKYKIIIFNIKTVQYGHKDEHYIIVAKKR